MKHLFISLCFCTISHLSAQAQHLAFISDTQEPMKVETILLKTDRNKEGADSLLTDLARRPHHTVFHLGDMVANGSSSSDWTRIDRFIEEIQAVATPVYPTYGNHEYLMTQGAGEKNFRQRFPQIPDTGYYVVQDSMAVVIFNSNFSKIGKLKSKAQQTWYEHCMDSLNREPGIKFIIVACHHSPYTNSNVVSPSKEVQQQYVPAYINTRKAVLFLSGHSHHLEVFDIYHKKFMVIGGGGGLWQPFKKEGKRDFTDILPEEQKPRYFYLEVIRQGNALKVQARGFTLQEFGQFKDFPVAIISLTNSPNAF